MLEAFEHTVLFIGLIGTCFGSFATAYLAYRRLILKCFSPFVAGLLVLLPYAMGSVYGMSMAQQRGAPILAAFGIPMLAVLPLLALPTLSNRRSIDRTYFPFRMVGALFFALAAVIGTDYVQAFEIAQFDNNFKLVSGLATMGIYMFWLHRRSRSRTSAHRSQKAQIGQLLFLRSFKRDIDLFIPSAPDDLLHLASNPLTRAGAYVSALKAPTNPGLTFEEFFSAEMKARIGPLVALGSPEDYLPPVGAARTYAPDEDWQAKLAEYAEESVLIVMEPDESANLGWELQYLRTHALQEKLILVTRPPMAILSHWSFLFWFSRYLRWARGIRETKWPAFVAMMSGFGYTLDSESPPPGSVFGFDSLGKAILLTTSADTPMDYVEPMAQWASARKATGRSLRLACSRCAGPCYLLNAADESVMPALCQKCAEEHLVAGLDGMRRLGRAIPQHSMLLYAWIFGGLVSLWALCWLFRRSTSSSIWKSRIGL
jgi:hypothetical protein